MLKPSPGSSGSSGGISAQLLGESHDRYEFEEDDLKMSFFFDIDVLIHRASEKIWEAEGHRTMLEATKSDVTLRLLSLLEGTTLDFIFGPEFEDKTYRVKKYIRSLHEYQQNIVADFYLQIYTVIIYYVRSTMEYGLCMCCVESKFRAILDESLVEEYQRFRIAISTQRNTGLIDDC